MALSASNLAEYFDAAAAGGAGHPILAFPSLPNSATSLRQYNINDVDILARKAQAHYCHYGLKPAATTLGSAKHEGDLPAAQPILGICAFGTIEWVATFIAAARLGYTVLVLSPRLPADSLGALLSRSNCQTLIYGQKLLEDKTIAQAPHHLNYIPIVEESDLSATTFAENSKSLEHQTSTSTSSIPPYVPTTAFIWHSSGSTGIPKLLHTSQFTCMERIRGYVAAPLARARSIFITSSTHNSAGLTFLLGAMVLKHSTTCFWNDRLSLTGKELVAFLEEIRPEYAALYPTALELILGFDADNETKNQVGTSNGEKQEQQKKRGISILKSCSLGVNSFGAVCPQEVGDELVREGVKFSIAYSMTEASRIMTSALRPGDDNEWDYMSIIPAVQKFVYMQPLFAEVQSKDASSMMMPSSELTLQKQKEPQHRLYGCTILPSNPNLDPASSNTSDPEPGSFATGDVFHLHPTKPDRWKILGRKDDQINMGIPVVVNSLEYENIIKSGLAKNSIEGSSAEVEEVVVFGQGRPKLGVLVFPKYFNISDDHPAPTVVDDCDKMIRDRIWDAIQMGINNEMSVGIGKDMIVIVDDTGIQSHPQSERDQESEDGGGTLERVARVPRTDKGNFMRPLVNLIYGGEIDKAYANAASSASTE